MIRLSIIFAAASLAITPAGASAQTLACAIPSELARPRADGPTPREPRRVLPIGGYTLALTWTPQHCRDHGANRSAAFQCASGNRFGFTLHGLWPDGEGARWPQYCRAAPLISEPVLRRNLCVTPSVQLLQHEYAKHGTCMGIGPAAYFDMARTQFQQLRFPDMTALSRRRDLTAGQFAAALARANPGIVPAMLRVTATKGGWLDEVWLCMDRQRRYATCPAGKPGLSPGTPLKIWRGGRTPA